MRPASARAQVDLPTHRRAVSSTVVGRPSAKDRKPYDIEAITDVAVRVFLERGYDGSSIEQVARAAGITKSSIYYHVAGKEELLARGVGRAFDALFAALNEPGATTGAHADRLRHAIQRTIEVTVQRMPEVALLVRVRGNTAAERRVLERRREFDHLIAQIVAEAARAGAIRADIQPRLATRLIWGMLNSITEWYRPDGELSARDIADAVFKLIFESIGHGVGTSPDNIDR
jgi:AcrR family transcriptional regulator